MIDRTICLALEHRVDRKQILEASYPSDLPPIEYFSAFTPRTCLVPGSWPHRHSYYATNLGHLRIIEKLWSEDNWSNVLILEDDALFIGNQSVNDLVRQLTAVAPDWLALFLGYTEQGHCPPINDTFKLGLGGVTQSHAYVINRHGLYRLYDHLWVKQFDVVDWAYCHLMREDHAFYLTIKQIVTTQAGYSENMFHSKRQGA